METSGYCDPRFGPVQAAFERNFADDGELGAAVSVVVDGECVVDLWGGHLDRARTQPWTADKIVNVYSTTKGMVALCAHVLVDRGQLDVDAPVATYWPEFAAAGKESIPVSMLLNHKAGLPAFAEKISLGELADWDACCSRLAAQPPVWAPGSVCGYHAVTYGFLVGEVIRRIDGRSVGRFFAEEIAEPLGLGGTGGAEPLGLGGTGGAEPLGLGGDGGDGAAFFIGVPASEHYRIAPLQDPVGDEGGGVLNLDALPEFGRLAMGNQPVGTAVGNEPVWRSAEIPGANGHGNARGLARVYGEVARGEVLSSSTLDDARRPQHCGLNVCLGLELEWLLGFSANPFGMYGPSPTAFGHGGMGGSAAFGDTDHRVGFAYTQNEIRVDGVDTRAFTLAQSVYESLGRA